MEIGWLIKKYENRLAKLEELNKDYDELVGLSDEDYYSAGEINGKVLKLKEVIKDLQEINRGD